jgi:hypothetical protein
MVVFTRRAVTVLKENLGAPEIIALRDASDDDIQLHSQFLQNRSGGEKKFYMALTERLDLLIYWRRLSADAAVWIVDDALEPAKNIYRGMSEGELRTPSGPAPFLQSSDLTLLFTLDDDLQPARFAPEE